MAVAITSETIPAPPSAATPGAIGANAHASWKRSVGVEAYVSARTTPSQRIA